MQFGAVTFVLAETIFRETRAEVTHHRVARHFRDHAGGGDAQAVAIPIDNRGLWKGERKNGQAIDQNVIGQDGEGRDGGAHRPVCRAQNVHSVDLDGIDNADRPRNFGIGDQLTVNFLAQFRRELFGIVQLSVSEFLRKNHRRRHNRTG